MFQYFGAANRATPRLIKLEGIQEISFRKTSQRMRVCQGCVLILQDPFHVPQAFCTRSALRHLSVHSGARHRSSRLGMLQNIFVREANLLVQHQSILTSWLCPKSGHPCNLGCVPSALHGRGSVRLGSWCHSGAQPSFSYNECHRTPCTRQPAHTFDPPSSCVRASPR